MNATITELKTGSRGQMKLTLGKRATGAAFSLGLDIVTQSLAILAKRGSGKTYTAAVLAEGLLRCKQQVVVLDPTGAWWGLKSSATGKSAGFPVVVFGGDHADLPLEPDSGEIIARAIVEKRFSAIVDLSHLRKGERVRFITAFAEALYRLNRQAMMLIVDEADAVAPQKVMHDEARMLGAMEDIVRRGRIRGIGCTLITQRPQVLNKNVLTQCEVLICLRLGHPKDIAAIKEWVGVHADEGQARAIISSLPALPVGTAWFWAPALDGLCERIAVRKRETFDSSATPKPGEIRAAPTAFAPIDVAQLGAEITATAARAAAEDPKALQKRIRELEAENANLQRSGTPAPEELKRAETAGYDRGVCDARRKFSLFKSEMLKIKASAERVLVYVGSAAPVEFLASDVSPDRQLYPVVPWDAEPAKPKRVRTSAPPARPGPPATTGAPAGGIRRMMIALAQRAGLNARQLGLRAGLSSKSGTFSTYLAKMRASGWLAGDRAGLELTPAGRAALGSYDPLPTGRALLHYWQKELGRSGAARMLDALSDAFPSALTREQLGAGAGISPSSGTFSTYLAKLRTLELVTGGSNLIRLSEELA